MTTWSEWERATAVAQKQMNQKSAVTCPHCSSTWFEQVEANQFDANHQIIHGQKVPTLQTNAVPFILLRCLRCGDTLQPLILSVMRDVAGSSIYDKFLDSMEGEGDLRTAKLEVDASALQTEVNELKLQVQALTDSLAKKSKKKDEV